MLVSRRSIVSWKNYLLGWWIDEKREKKKEERKERGGGKKKKKKKKRERKLNGYNVLLSVIGSRLRKYEKRVIYGI